jgi:MFS family permease
VSPPGRRAAARALAIAALTLAVQNGIVMAFAVLYLPLVEAFSASRAEAAAVQSTVLLLGGVGGPLVGWLFDRLGPRRLFQAGALLAAGAFLAASQTRSLTGLVLSYGLVGGLGLAALGSQANMTLAALWYPGARGRAIAVADLGTGLGAFGFIPLAHGLVGRVGWRGTLRVWALLLLGVVLPLNALQRVPAAAARDEAVGRARPPGEPWTVERALRFPGFWWLALMRFAAACAFPLMNVHMVAYAVGQGIAPATAAAALGTVSLVSLAGRLTTGWLSDRLGRAPALTLTYTSAALGIGALALLSVSPRPLWLAVYVALYGMAQGSSGIVASARAADLFAGPRFGTIYGWLTLAVGPGEALGAWIGGAVYDRTGSYLGAFAVAVVALGVGLLAIWRVHPTAAPRPPRPAG